MRGFNKYTPKSIVTSDGVTLYYEVPKEKSIKKSLIFLHGLGGDTTAWDVERELLDKQGYASVGIDLRGHGLSQRPHNEGDYALERFAKDIAEIIQHEGITRPILIGHCFGGMVSLVLENIQPQISEGMVLIDTSYRLPHFSDFLVSSPLLNKVVNLLAKNISDIHIGKHNDYDQYIGTSDYNLHRLISDLAHTSLRSYLLICENLTKYNAIDILKAIKIPTFIIEGTEDSVFPPDVAQSLHERIKKSQLEMVKGANHILVISNPKEIVEEILPFLKKIEY